MQLDPKLPEPPIPEGIGADDGETETTTTKICANPRCRKEFVPTRRMGGNRRIYCTDECGNRDRALKSWYRRHPRKGDRHAEAN